MKSRLLLGVLLVAGAVAPAAWLGWSVRGFAEEPAKSSNTVAMHDDGTLAEPAPKTPAQAASEKREEQEFFEMYKALADTVDQVDRNYVKKIDRRELMEAAIKGVLSKLDPYSSYIGPEDAGRFKDTVENQFGGIGIQIVAEDGQIKVLSPLLGSPAYKAGLQAGDRILKIGGQSAVGMLLDDAVHKLKGDVGTSVSLTVAHAIGGKQETVTVNRELIHVDTVLGDHRKSDDTWDFMLDPERRIGYICITTFSRDTAQDLKKAMIELKAQKLRGLILDLRFNPGGLLTAAVDTCDMFLKEGRIVSTEGRNSPKRVWDATKKSDAYSGFPMVVLVNHYSASASEIVSACLQDHQRAIVIGDRTWGKGSVQNVIELEDGKSLLKLTTASYKRPNGHNIHRFPDSKESDEWGVMPNPGFAVKLSEEEMGELLAERRERDILLPQKKANPPDANNAKPDAKTQAAHDAKKPDAGKSETAKAHDLKPDAGKPEAAKPEAAKADSEKPANDRQLQKAIDYLTTELAKTS
ncbi:MAG TPA: S41 family peptidase [Pirellulales bacterium]|jgi:carboxyl-terminal processing protease|nr:S41 family peptidase [Pirellulales bacterium]